MYYFRILNFFIFFNYILILSKNSVKIKNNYSNVNFCFICGTNEKLEYHQMELPKLKNKSLNKKKNPKNPIFILCKRC